MIALPQWARAQYYREQLKRLRRTNLVIGLVLLALFLALVVFCRLASRYGWWDKIEHPFGG